jgi:hypothetical protein
MRCKADVKSMCNMEIGTGISPIEGTAFWNYFRLHGAHFETKRELLSKR